MSTRTAEKDDSTAVKVRPWQDLLPSQRYAWIARFRPAPWQGEEGCLHRYASLAHIAARRVGCFFAS